MNQWERDRAEIAARARALADEGLCPTCYDLATGDLFGNADRVIYEDDRFKVVLERYPPMAGHTIVIYKPHR